LRRRRLGGLAVLGALLAPGVPMRDVGAAFARGPGLAGVFLLVAPRIVSFAVAVYLIFVGILGLNGIYHLFN